MTQTPARAKRPQTARELADRFGVSPRTIRRTVALPRDEYLNAAEKRHQQIRALRSEGLSMRAIAAEMSISVGTVHYALKKPHQS